MYLQQREQVWRKLCALTSCFSQRCCWLYFTHLVVSPCPINFSLTCFSIKLWQGWKRNPSQVSRLNFYRVVNLHSRCYWTLLPGFVNGAWGWSWVFDLSLPCTGANYFKALDGKCFSMQQNGWEQHDSSHYSNHDHTMLCCILSYYPITAMLSGMNVESYVTPKGQAQQKVHRCTPSRRREGSWGNCFEFHD